MCWKLKMDLKDLIYNGAAVSVTISAKDLNAFARSVAEDTCREVETKLIAMGDLQCITSQQVCELLQIDPSTLWRWKRDGYLIPTTVGCSPRYRMRDIQQLLEGKGVEK